VTIGQWLFEDRGFARTEFSSGGAKGLAELHDLSGLGTEF